MDGSRLHVVVCDPCLWKPRWEGWLHIHPRPPGLARTVDASSPAVDPDRAEAELARVRAEQDRLYDEAWREGRREGLTGAAATLAALRGTGGA